ncbi:MAG: potassium channel family protein [Anaerosomatales bacterium]|nr:potassium channel family protein [Anaerosomatales bacterium]MDT8434895.1 potassium channel family protein [Anaerosomatales bacterium]
MGRVMRWVERVSVLQLLLGINTLLVVFAFAYWALSEPGSTNGLIETYEPEGQVSFLDALYFSVVSLSSLGYGDVRPLGFSRLLAGAEVIIGLSFFGIMVAKISSVRQDYILRRMYYSELIDGRLEGFAHQLEEHRKLYLASSTMLLGGDNDPELAATYKDEVTQTTIFFEIHAVLHDVVDMFVLETRSGGFFDNVSDALLMRIYASVQSMMHHTIHLADRDAEAAGALVFCGNEQWIGEMLELAEEIARLGRKHSKSTDIVRQCGDILEAAAKIRTDVMPLVSGAVG